LEALQSYLWDSGHEAEIATDGIECSLILNEYTPDVVMLADDLLWGGIEGVMAKMSETPLLSNIPVIQIEAQSLLESKFAIRGHQLVARLRKPIRIGEVTARLNSLTHSSHIAFRSDEGVNSWQLMESTFNCSCKLMKSSTPEIAIPQWHSVDHL